MTEYPRKPNLKSVGTSQLEALHDMVIAGLDAPDKAGIYTLLKNNNRVFKRELYKYLAAKHHVIDSAFFSAMDNLLDIHARESYTIGYLDSLGTKNERIPGSGSGP